MEWLLSLFQVAPTSVIEKDGPFEPKLNRRIYGWLTATVAVGFVHYIYSLALVLIGGILFCIWPQTRQCLLKDKMNGLIFAVSAIATVVAIVYGNWPGLGAGILFFLCFVMAFVFREFATKTVTENLFSVTIMASYFSVIVAVVEKIYYVNVGQPHHRCSAVSSNPNFYGIMATLVIMLCIHKTVTVSRNRWVFYVSALVNGVGLFLCGSASLWLVIFVFVTLYYWFAGRRKAALVFIGLAVAVVIAVFAIPQLMPRLQEKPWQGSGRFLVYRSALGALDESPLFGRGFLSYRYWRFQLGESVFPQKVSLCHNITLDCLLSQGLVGTILIETFFVRYIVGLIRLKKVCKQQSVRAYSLPLAAAALIAATFYGLVDTTLLWPQSGLLLLFVLGACGVDERAVPQPKSELQWQEEPDEIHAKEMAVHE